MDLEDSSYDTHTQKSSQELSILCITTTDVYIDLADDFQHFCHDFAWIGNIARAAQHCGFDESELPCIEL